MLKAACFISGRGSNLRSLIAGAQHYKILAVLSDNPEAKGLEYARSENIPTYAISKTEAGSLAAQKSALYNHAASLKPDIILLAGYMQIVSASFIDQFKDRIINIHPSLLPNFPGLNTHQRAISSGVKEHGCTVHVVIPEVDSGTIIAQAACQVVQEDNVKTLTDRVLELEHKLYPWVVNCIGSGDIKLKSGKISFNQQAKILADKSGFLLPQI